MHACIHTCIHTYIHRYIHVESRLDDRIIRSCWVNCLVFGTPPKKGWLLLLAAVNGCSRLGGHLLSVIVGHFSLLQPFTTTLNHCFVGELKWFFTKPTVSFQWVQFFMVKSLQNPTLLLKSALLMVKSILLLLKSPFFMVKSPMFGWFKKSPGTPTWPLIWRSANGDTTGRLHIIIWDMFIRYVIYIDR